ncbi:MAG: hypothetical protein U0525_04100 [Patescibacteria group bacterium]
MTYKKPLVLAMLATTLLFARFTFAAIEDPPTDTPTPPAEATVTPTPEATETPATEPTETLTPTPEGPTATPTEVITPPPAQLNEVPMCPKTIYCKDDPSCAQTDKSSLGEDVYKGHRQKITNTGLVLSSTTKYFFRECITNTSGNKYCVPMPLIDNGDGTYNVPTKANWKTDRDLFINAMLQRCRAGYTNEIDANAGCSRDNILGNATANPPIPQSVAFTELDNFLGNELDYTFLGLYVPNGDVLTPVGAQPFTIPASGYEWADSSKYGVDVTKVLEIVRFTGFGGETGQGNSQAPHVSQLGMPNPQAICSGAAYDPYGRVFDSNTLMPVANAYVWIFTPKKMADGVTVELDAGGNPIFEKYISSDPVFTNPGKTTITGSFSFRLPSGTYKILVNNSPSSLDGVTFSDLATFPGSNVDTNFVGDKAVVNILGKNITLYPEVYSGTATDPAPSLVQTNKPIHKNIAVTGLTTTNAQIVSWDQFVTPTGNKVIYGTTNIPYVKVGLFTTAGREIKSMVTGSDAKFVMTIFPETLSAGEEFGLPGAYDPTFTRVVTSINKMFGEKIASAADYLIGLVVKPVMAQNFPTKMPSSPNRFAHLEGFAFDKVGKVLPYTEVLIMDTVGFTVSYRTVAGGDGYFVVPAAYLPPRTYQIMYKPKGSDKVINVSNAAFVAQNARFLSQNKVDLNRITMSAKAQAYVDANPKLYPEVVTTTVIETTPGAGNNENPSVKTTGAPNQNQQKQNAMPNMMLLVYIVILLILVVGVGILVVYYLKKKQEPHIYDQQI